jgi:tRNA-binding protein
VDTEGVPPVRDPVTIDDFERLDMRVGRLVAAEDFPAARKPAYQLTIDFGPLGIRRSSAQLTQLYSRDDLIGRLVIAVLNFPPRRIAGFSSEVLVLGLPDASGNVVLLTPEREVPLGGRVY